MTEELKRISDALASRYAIERVIGRGGMATVYLARDLRHDRQVALKVFAPESLISRGGERFLAEIRISARLAHPNILPLHDSGDAEGFLYYVMPYVPGENLRQRLEREGPLPIGDAVQIAREVADALAYAHAHDVVHRDIKPENILFLAEHAVVADFGIASAISRALRRTSPGESTALQRENEDIPATIPMLGTPYYMSPEQATGGLRLDGRSDIYSLGCVLFEMLVGEPPFLGPDPSSLVAAHLHDPVRSLRPKRPSIPPALETIVKTSLAKVPGDRFATAARMAEALTGVERGAPRRTREPSPRWRWLAGLSLLALLILTLRLLPRLAGAPPLDPSLYLVLPFAHRAGAAPELLSGDQCESLLHAALSRWEDVRLVDPLWVADAALRRGRAATLRDGLAIARERGAGRLLTGEVWLFRDTIRVRAALYDVGEDGRVIREQRVQITRDLHNAETGFETLADSLLVGGARSSGAAGGAMGTRSIAAWRSFDEGHVALERWDLAGAKGHFRDAVSLDPDYALARLWLAQVGSWKGDPPDDWMDDAAAALTPASRLTPPTRHWGEALSALGAGHFAQACDGYRAILARDSLDFRGWYGLGECQARNRTVARDPRSPSGWRFVASYHAAIEAYRRALSVLPSVHLAFRGAAFGRLSNLLFTGSNQVHTGFAVERDTLWFGSFAALEGDTLALVPWPMADLIANRPGVYPASNPSAVTRNRETLRQITTAWVRSFPNSPDAAEANALALEALGWLGDDRSPEQSALAQVQRARGLATDSVALVRLGVAEVRLLLKLERFEPAARRADSLLLAHPTPGPELAWSLAGLAALTGRGARTADLLARSAPLFHPSTPEGQPIEIPLPIKETGRSLLGYASLGGPADSITALARRIGDQLQSYVELDRREQIRLALLDKPRTLVFPQLEPRGNGGRGDGGGLRDLQRRLARGDTGGVRQGISQLDASRRAIHPGDIAMEFTFQEAVLLLGIGDTAAAVSRLDRVLNALPTLGPDLLAEVPQAAAVTRAMALRAEVAVGKGDGVVGRRWARGVALLWAQADASLGPTLERIRKIDRR